MTDYCSVTDVRNFTKVQIGEYSDTSVGGSIDNTEVQTWYQLLRNLQGEIKPYIDGSVNHMIDSSNFIKDSLFCEYVYIVNLDSMELEIFKGYQQRQHIFSRYGTEKNNGGYYPCKVVKTYPLSDLPDEELFLHQMKTNDEDDFENLEDEDIPYKPSLLNFHCDNCGRFMGYYDESGEKPTGCWCEDCKRNMEDEE